MKGLLESEFFPMIMEKLYVSHGIEYLDRSRPYTTVNEGHISDYKL